MSSQLAGLNWLVYDELCKYRSAQDHGELSLLRRRDRSQ
uniref:Uncharacterized protein n=1 Tax=Arundo donax TaxID=35708 RepID=A0A0A9EL53_ARUDO